MKRLKVKLAANPYEIWIGPGILEKAGNLLGDHGGRAFIVADSRLSSAVMKLARALRDRGWKTAVRRESATESLKDIRRIYPIYDWLLKNGADRHSVVFALGGGVIGDALGFVASTYLRGIRWVGIPTTLLAQIDSSIGGKTGINHAAGKNLIGAFHQPARVICDTALLATLSKRDRISGLGEMIKYGLIYDPGFYAQLERGWREIADLEPHALARAVARCAEWKARVVARDERDLTGIREALNFGHTVGHALEAETGYGYFRHGEAIILGMRAACQLSRIRGELEAKTQARIDRFLSSLPVPTIPARVTTQKIRSRLKQDKKAKNGKVRFVLLTQIGGTTLDRDVRPEEIQAAIDWLRKSAQ